MPDRPKPPSGYETWIDYAVATMDTRDASIIAAATGEGCDDREAMREAVVSDLAALREKAAKWDSYVEWCEEYAEERPDPANVYRDGTYAELRLMTTTGHTSNWEDADA